MNLRKFPIEMHGEAAWKHATWPLKWVNYLSLNYFCQLVYIAYCDKLCLLWQTVPAVTNCANLMTNFHQLCQPNHNLWLYVFFLLTRCLFKQGESTTTTTTNGGHQLPGGCHVYLWRQRRSVWKPVASAGPGQDQATLCGPIQAAACTGQVEVALEVGQS